MSKLHEYLFQYYENVPTDEFATFFEVLPTENNNLKSFLSHTRHEKIGAPAMALYYNVLFQPVKRVLKRYRLSSSLLITYSMNRRTEAIQIGEEWHIIHDQYLGKAFNLFNKIVRDLKDPSFVTCFCLRYLVEQFRINGLAVEADLFFNIAMKQGLMDKLNEAYRSLNKRPEITFAQETYILFHELSHILVKRNPRICRLKEKQIRNFIDEMPVMKLRHLSESYKEGVIEEQFKKVLVEEIVCDYLAMKFTAETFSDKNLLGTKDLIVGINHCMRMVRTMNLLSALVSGYAQSRSTGKTILLNDSMIHSSVRLYAIKYIFDLTFYESEDKMEVREAMHEILTDFSEEDQYFEDPVFEINAMLNKIVTDESHKMPNLTYAEKLQVYDYIDQSLGWKPRK